MKRLIIIAALLVVTACGRNTAGPDGPVGATVTQRDCETFETEFSTLTCTANILEREFEAQSYGDHGFQADDGSRPATYRALELLKDRPEMRQCHKLSAMRNAIVNAGMSRDPNRRSGLLLPSVETIQNRCRQGVAEAIHDNCAANGACDPNPEANDPNTPIASPMMRQEARIITQRCYRTLDKQETRQCVERGLVAASPEMREAMMKLLPPL